MFLIRQAGPKDFPGVFQLARLLDSYNLPADRSYIRRLLAISEESFRGRRPKPQARYLFVLEERSPRRRRRIVGCSLIIAKHGTRGHPHLWFGLDTLTKRSRSLGVVRRHPVLKMGSTEDGPTEVGGLVVLPRYRRHPHCLGLQISYVRFLYMRLHPERFEPEVLVEYRGALGEGNRSLFWERIGRVFTGLSYKRADRLSVANKEFILGLLPREPIYCALLPVPVQKAIGAIHPGAQPAAKLLAGIGFRKIPQVEPFDGGPYYTARRRQIRIVRQARRLAALQGKISSGRPALVGTQVRGFFRAAVVSGRVRGQHWEMGREGFRLLQLKEGDPVYAFSLGR